MPGLNDPRAETWWRDAVTYQVYVRSFADADGDGLGDLPGITDRLPYLVDLGVDALWITPFYPSPQHDAGYDVADYVDVDPRFGTLADFDALVARAHQLGLRLLVDLVPNHTSSDHPWFQAALAARPGSPERARYLFRPGRGPGGAEPPNNWRSVFGGIAWDRVDEDADGVAQWYLHLFDSTQPDLDWRNHEVGDMFESVLRFWLDRGVDGFRVDVAHSLLKDASLPDQRAPDRAPPGREEADPERHGPHHDDEPMWDQPEVHDVYRRWRRVLDDYPGHRMAVAEAWTRTTESMAKYIRPDELHQSFNFAWLLADWSASTFASIIEETLAAVATVNGRPTWVLSNHDVVRHPTRYGGGPRGLARARAATLAMLALPGSAYLYQGEELGLEEVEVAAEHRQDPAWFRTGTESRDGCRVPLPWSGTAPPFGFGPGPGDPWIPQPPEWAELTVERQRADPTSTHAFYRRALLARREHALGADDTVDLVDLGPDVLAFRRGRLLVVLNAGTGPTPLPAGEVVASSTSESPSTLAPDTAVWLITD